MYVESQLRGKIHYVTGSTQAIPENCFRKWKLTGISFCSEIQKKIDDCFLLDHVTNKCKSR